MMSEETKLSERKIDSEELMRAIEALTLVVQKQVNNQRDWKLVLRNGMVAGLGGLLGATLIVSTLVYFLEPLKRIEAWSPAIERLDNALKKPQK